MPNNERPRSWEEEREAGIRSWERLQADREIDEDAGWRGTSPTRREREDAIREALRQKEKEEAEDERRRG